MADSLSPVSLGTFPPAALGTSMLSQQGGGRAISEATGSAGADAISGAWLEQAKGTLLNLGTGEGEMLRFLSNELNDASPAEQLALQQLTEQRNRTIGVMTQIIRSIGETARQIISNIR